MLNKDEDLFNKIELERIEQEALIEAAQMVAKNPHIDINYEKEAIIKRKIKEIKEIHNINALEYEKVMQEIRDELKKWEEEDKERSERRRQLIINKLETARNEKIKKIQRLEREKARRYVQIEQEKKEELVKQIKERAPELEKQIEKNNDDRIKEVKPEDFEALFEKRKKMLETLEVNPETKVERQIRKNMEGLDALVTDFIEKKDTEKEKNEEYEAVRIHKKNMSKNVSDGLSKYQSNFEYYQTNKQMIQQKTKSNVIKAGTVKSSISFRESLKVQIDIDHKKAKEEAKKKAKERDTFIPGIIIK